MLQNTEPGQQLKSDPLSCIQAKQALQSNWSSNSSFFDRTSNLPTRTPPKSGPAGSSEPAVPTSLDPDETTVGSISCFDLENKRKSGAKLNQAFRHSFWKARRSATLTAFYDLSVSQGKLDRFTSCGSVSWVLRAKCNDQQFRLASNGCRDRWCEACSSERRRTVVRNVRDKLEGMELRLLTLTLKSSNASLSDQLSRLYRCFRAFRNRAKIKKCMNGGLYFVELTINEKTGLWHPHLHVLFAGSYLPHRLASSTWLSCSSDSYIVDIVRVRDASGAAAYVAKYAGKSVPRSVWTDPDHFREAIVALAGRRLFSTFGTFKGLDLSKNPADDVGWDCIAPLHEVILHARNGDSYCCLIIKFLTGGKSYESSEYFDTG